MVLITETREHDALLERQVKLIGVKLNHTPSSHGGIHPWMTIEIAPRKLLGETPESEQWLVGRNYSVKLRVHYRGHDLYIEFPTLLRGNDVCQLLKQFPGYVSLEELTRGYWKNAVMKGFAEYVVSHAYLCVRNLDAQKINFEIRIGNFASAEQIEFKDITIWFSLKP